MGVSFSADDIFEIAERKEQDAAAFYNSAAKQVDMPGGRQLLEELAGWEEKHEKIFAEMRKKLTDQEKESTAFDPYDENTQYLKAMADHSTARGRYADPGDFLGENPDMVQILNVALDKEKDAIAFYTGIKDIVPDTRGKEDIGNIIGEEKRHVRIITEELLKHTSS